MVPGKKIFKCFTIYGHGSHLGHVTSIMLYLQANIKNLAENDPGILRKASLIPYVIGLGPRSTNDLDLQYTHLVINSFSFRSQAAIISEKNPLFSLFPIEKPKLQNLTLP